MMHKQRRILCALGVLLFSLVATESHSQSLSELLFGTKDFFSSHIVAMAKDYEGLHEKQDRRSLEAVTGVDPVRTPWCAAFINALLEKQGRMPSDSNKALSFLGWGVKTHDPKPGDVVVMRGHVTLFVGFSEDGKRFFGLGGNQKNQVRITEYSIKKVISFRTYSAIFVPEYLPKKNIKKKSKHKPENHLKRKVILPLARS